MDKKLNPHKRHDAIIHAYLNFLDGSVTHCWSQGMDE